MTPSSLQLRPIQVAVANGEATVTAGVDIASIQRLGVLLGAQKQFATNIFRPEEIDYCLSFRDPAVHFAARFAAKEATLKALQMGLGVPPVMHRLRDVEVCRALGPPRLRLHNRMAEKAHRLGIRGASLSLSHDCGLAIAYVLLSWEADTRTQIR